MRAAPKHLEAVERVVRAFGYWPSFHDATLREIHHDESGKGAVLFTLGAFEMTREVEERVSNGVMGRYFILTKHHDVSFRFDDVTEVVFPTHGDCLSVLEIGNERDDDGRFLVVLESSIGHQSEGYGASFRARTGAVLDVVATSPDAK
jgi:hypothetical protein